MGEIFTTAMLYYVIAVAVLSLLGGFLLRRMLLFIEQKRKKRLNKSDASNLLASHIDDQIDPKKQKQQRLESLKNRFSITRRALYCALLILALVLVLAPIMHKVSPVLVSAIIACISVIIGIAARPFIENLICGLVLCFGRLARIGDVVLVDDQYGTIEDVTLTHCIVRRWDWLRYVIPNSSMMTKEFVNYSLRDNHRWVHVEFFVRYDSDMELVEELAKSSPQGSEYYSGDEDPRFWITELTERSVKCMVVAWATSAADGWMLSIDIRRRLLEKLKDNNIATHVENIELHKTEQKG